MGATLDGIVPDDGAVFEAKFMLPWNFAEDVAADKHMAQLQHNMLVTGSRRAYLSILPGYCRFAFSRTPGPPPFSGMNSMPAVSRARSIAAISRLLHRWIRLRLAAADGRSEICADAVARSLLRSNAESRARPELRACDHIHAMKQSLLDCTYGAMYHE